MFAQQLAASIDAAHTLARLDELSRSIWQAVMAGALGDEAAQLLAERVHAKRTPVRRDAPRVGIPAGRASIFPKRRYQRSPDRAASIERRRRLAASGPMPPRLAAMFTTAELATLRIICDEARHKGQSEATVAEIAARAGVCRTTAKNAIRTAAALGLLLVEERRRRGQKNLPNIIRIISREWRDWMRKHPTKSSERTAVKKMAPTHHASQFRNGQVRGKPSIGPAWTAGTLSTG